MKYLREATLPLYILHHVLVVVFGWYIVQLPLGILAKFCFLTTLTLMTTIAIYHFLLRRLSVLRFLFGMRPLQPAAIPEMVIPIDPRIGGIPGQASKLQEPVQQ